MLFATSLMHVPIDSYCPQGGKTPAVSIGEKLGEPGAGLAKLFEFIALLGAAKRVKQDAVLPFAEKANRLAMGINRLFCDFR